LFRLYGTLITFTMIIITILIKQWNNTVCINLRQVTTGIDERETTETSSLTKAGKHARTTSTRAARSTVKSVFSALTTTVNKHISTQLNSVPLGAL